MNATDHPHGGGRGKSKGGNHPRDKWNVSPALLLLLHLGRVVRLLTIYDSHRTARRDSGLARPAASAATSSSCTSARRTARRSGGVAARWRVSHSEGVHSSQLAALLLSGAGATGRTQERSPRRVRFSRFLYGMDRSLTASLLIASVRKPLRLVVVVACSPLPADTASSLSLLPLALSPRRRLFDWVYKLKLDYCSPRHADCNRGTLSPAHTPLVDLRRLS